MDVKVIKFVNGQEIIAKVTTTTDTQVVIQSPLTLQPLRTGDSAMSIGLMPFTWGGDSRHPIALNAAHILCVMESESELKSQYLAALSGLALPSRSTSKLTLVE